MNNKISDEKKAEKNNMSIKAKLKSKKPLKETAKKYFVQLQIRSTYHIYLDEFLPKDERGEFLANSLNALARNTEMLGEISEMSGCILFHAKDGERIVQVGQIKTVSSIEPEDTEVKNEKKKKNG